MLDVVRAMRRRIWFIVLPAVLAAVGAVLFTRMFVSPVYQASSQLIVHHVSGAGGAPDLGSVTLNLRLMETYKQILKTEAVMERVAALHPELQATPSELLARVAVSSAPESQVMTVTVRDRTYHRAAAIANAVSFVFRDMVPEIMRVDNVTVLSEAKTDLSPPPIAPRPAVNAAVAFVLALLVAGSVAFYLEYTDNTVRTPEDLVAVLGVPALVAVPEAARSDFRIAGRERQPQGQPAKGRPAKEVTYAPIQR